MAGIPEHIIDQVRDRTDIVEIISQYIPLKKAGRNFKAVCPFHHEKTPSFMVSPAKQIFHCFGCGAGGNAFNFLMKYERLEFPEAVAELAKRAGITIPASAGPKGEGSSVAEKLHAVNEMAAAFYRDNLLKNESSKVSRDYLRKRNIEEQTIDRFKLGYAPNIWNAFFKFMKKKGFDESVLEKSGLVIKGREGSFFDRFRDRIIFPITDARGAIKGFGSRVMDNSQPKYMNSPETFIYSKGNHLYGLHSSWEEIRDKNSAVIVEGYIDFLTPYQHGFKNIVASLGTALTVEQIRLLKRYTNNVIILFDADPAGENATIRSLDMLIEEEMKVKVVKLPAGFDPDSYINKSGPAAFRQLIDGAQDLFDYKLNLMLERHDRKTLDGKTRIADEMLPLISKIKNAILRSGYIKRLAEILSVDEDDLKSELKKVRPDYTYRYQPVLTDKYALKSNMAEKILVGVMLEDAAFVESVKSNLTSADFKNPAIREIVEKLFQFHTEKKTPSPSKLIDCFKEKEHICASISELIATCENLVDKKKSLEDCIQWIKDGALKERLKGLCDQIKFAQDEGNDVKVVELVTRYNDMIKGVKPS